MVLIKWEDGFVSGRYWNSKTNKVTELSGESHSANTFHLYEGDYGSEAGVFEGQLKDSTTFSGLWKSTKNSEQFPFEFTEYISNADSLGWSGNWYFNDVWDNGVLMIGNVTNKRFDFALSLNRGGHQGAIEGQASLKNNTATFVTTEFDVLPCQLKFIFNPDHILIEQLSSNFSCGFGARAFAGGRYDRIYKTKKASIPFGSDPTYIFPNQEVHDAFLTLVGQEGYNIFAFNMQISEQEMLDPKDRFQATAVSGYIPGLINSNEAIIIYDKQNKIWAATLFNDRKSGESLVLYFTNDLASKAKLPHTIENWRSGFNGYRVLFQFKGGK
jgi:hypothetical protein